MPCCTKPDKKYFFYIVEYLLTETMLKLIKIYTNILLFHYRLLVLPHLCVVGVIEQKGMTFDDDFGYSLPPFLFAPKKKREEEKENEVAKIVFKSNAFLLDQWGYIKSKQR